jgi:glucose-1-phosphate cytidylyltransferase
MPRWRPGVADGRVPVVILCGGMGTRLAEQTEIRPKPLVEIGGRPILWHIMKHYSRYGFNEFVLALGYKGDHIKRYFLDYHAVGQDMTITLQDGRIAPLSSNREPWTVHLVDTGEATLTGGRLRNLRPVIGETTFMLTYGDGVGNVALDRLLEFHRSRGALATLTAVRPPARFGALEFDGDRIRHFKEKSTLHEGWINGGFFVVEPRALDYITSDVMWEHAPMEALAKDGQLFAYRHEEFWQCMDTVRDLRYLESLWDAGQAPWKTW